MSSRNADAGEPARSSSLRLEELSTLNVLFCLLVILIHILSHAVVNLDKLSWQYALVLIPQRLAFVSVPGFFFLSGLKLTLPRKKPRSLTNYYLNRGKRLLLPYLLAAAVYYLYFVGIGWYAFSPVQFLQETALGTLSAPFYFLIALTQFILLAPVFQWLARRYHPAFLLPLALGVTWLSGIYFNDVLQLISPNLRFLYGDRLFTSYLIYYLAGYCAGTEYQSFLTSLEENRSLFTAAAIFFGLADGFFSLRVFSRQQAAPHLELIHTLYILSAIPVLCLWSVKHKNILSGRMGPLLRATDRASYLIYLYHCLIITEFNRRAPRLAGDRVSLLLLLRIIAVYPAAIAGSILWQRLWAAVRKKFN